MVDLTNTGQQYRDSNKLEARARLQQRYGTAAVPWFSWVARHAAFSAGDAVLDIGCGPGWFWERAASALPTGLAIQLADTSPGMIEEALPRVRSLDRGQTVTGRVADVTDLSFHDGAFDRVLALHMLYHATDPTQGVREIARALKAGGIALIALNGRRHMREMTLIAHDAFGGPKIDPSAEAFGIELAEPILRRTFDKVRLEAYDDRLVCTDPDDLFDAMTSFPPGSEADDAALARARDLIADAFGSEGRLTIEKEVGLFVCRKHGTSFAR
jgi:SAM-dependent methyltransferase